MSEAENCHDTMHGLANGFATALMMGAANGRAKHSERAANVARCSSAAASARSEVYEASNAQLRERLADAESDVGRLTAERDELEDKLRNVCSYVASLRAAGKIAA